MADRLTRREMKGDKFVEDVELLYTFINEHRKTLILAAAAVVAVVVVAWGVYAWMISRDDAAQARLADAIEIYGSPVGTAPAGEGAPAPKYKTNEEKLAKAEPIFKEVQQKYGRSDAAEVANAYLARIAADRGKIDEAKSKLSGIVQSDPERLMAAAAQMGLYNIELAENPKQLATRLETALNDPKSLLPKDALLWMLGQAWSGAGDAEKAKSAWERLTTEFPDSPYAGDAQQKISH
ncbi:MAG: tetratricopeptide repeat protein [Thermoanaerobaculia bacterium]